MKNLNKWKWEFRAVRTYTSWVTFKTHYCFKNQLFYRYPKTMNELKQYDKKYCRPKRKLIPTAWSDLRTSRLHSKCWKDRTKRKRQWKFEKHSREISILLSEE